MDQDAHHKAWAAVAAALVDALDEMDASGDGFRAFTAFVYETLPVPVTRWMEETFW